MALDTSQYLSDADVGFKPESAPAGLMSDADVGFTPASHSTNLLSDADVGFTPPATEPPSLLSRAGSALKSYAEKPTATHAFATGFGEGFQEGAPIGESFGPASREWTSLMQRIGLSPTTKNWNAFNTLTGMLVNNIGAPVAGSVAEAVNLTSRVFEGVVKGGIDAGAQVLKNFGVEPQQANDIARDALGPLEIEAGRGGEIPLHEAAQTAREFTAARNVNAPIPQLPKPKATPADVMAAPDIDTAIAKASEAAQAEPYDIEAEGMKAEAAAKQIEQAAPAPVAAETPQVEPTVPEATAPVSETPVAAETEAPPNEEIPLPEAAPEGPEAEEPTEPTAPAFDRLKYVSKARSYVIRGSGSLKPDAVAKALGIEPEQAAQVMGALAAQRDSGLMVTAKGTLRRTPTYSGPQDLIQWIGRNGGIARDSDMEAMDAHRAQTGAGPVARAGGRDADYVREAVNQEGYGPYQTINDLYKAIDENLRGNRQFVVGEYAEDKPYDPVEHEHYLDQRASALDIERAPNSTLDQYDAAITEAEARRTPTHTLPEVDAARQAEIDEVTRGLLDEHGLEGYLEPRTAAEARGAAAGENPAGAHPPEPVSGEPRETGSTRPETESRSPDVAASGAASGTGEAGSAVAAPKFALAYHGSPYDFDQFENEKIGSGEGAAAYGWGHYFAGKKEVAEFYKNKLSSDKDRQVVGGAALPSWVANAIERGQNIDELIQTFRVRVGEAEERVASKAPQYWNDQSNIGPLRDIVSTLENIKSGKAKLGPKGRLYQVDLKPSEDAYLDWDRPVDEQPQNVKDALAKAGIGVETKPPGWDVSSNGTHSYSYSVGHLRVDQGHAIPNRDIGGFDVYHPYGPSHGYGADRNYRGHAPTAEQAREWIEKSAAPSATRTGYTDLLASRNGKMLYHGLSTKMGSDEKASEALRQAGIPGIRYLDQGSRDSGAGSHNYVIFDPSHIAVQAKFALRGKGEESHATPFFSALTRAIESSKQEKAAPGQWLAQIKNTPGVKSEEMEWSGVGDWLNSHAKPVSKADLLDYLKAHEVDVREVMHGSGRMPPVALADDLRRWVSANVTDSNQRMRGLVAIQDAEAGHVHGVAALEELGAPNNLIDPFREWANPEGRGAKFGSYTLPGGKNYRELLLTLPNEKPFNLPDGFEIRQMPGGTWNLWDGKQWVYDTERFRSPQDVERVARESNFGPGHAEPERQFRSSHWDEPNVLAHVRFDDRTGPNGEKILHVAEIQSDWHQKGRKSGYALDSAERERLDQRRQQLEREGREAKDAGREYPDERKQEWADLMMRLQSDNHGVPDAPFKTTWPELAMKRILRWAVEESAKREDANWSKIIEQNPDAVAHALVKRGMLKEICD